VARALVLSMPDSQREKSVRTMESHVYDYREELPRTVSRHWMSALSCSVERGH
jgi:hypothetical protein